MALLSYQKKINEIKKFSIGHEINYNLNTTLNIINSKMQS